MSTPDSERPFVTSGMALAMPSPPVVTPTPAPVRLNHSSTVKFGAPRAGAAPKVTYWLDPFRVRAVPTDTPGVAAIAGVAGDAWPSLSTAVRT